MPSNLRPIASGDDLGGDHHPTAELARLRDENRRLAISLGAFSAFLASRGLLEEAWSYVHSVHEMDDGGLVEERRLAG